MFGALISFMGGAKLKLIGAGIIALLLWAAWSHYTYIRDDRIQLIKDKAIIETALKTEKASFSSYKITTEKNYKDIQEDIISLDKDYKKSEKKVRKFSKMLERHDLGHLTFKKPGLIERKANRATKKVFKDFEELGE